MGIIPLLSDSPSALRFSLSTGRGDYLQAGLSQKDSSRFLQLLKDRSNLSWEALAVELGYGSPSGKSLLNRIRGDQRLPTATVRNLVDKAFINGWLTLDEKNEIDSLMRVSESATADAKNHRLLLSSLAKDFSKIYAKIGREKTEQDCVNAAAEFLQDELVRLMDEMTLDMSYDASCYDDAFLEERKPKPTVMPGL